ncbi:MAG: hypothetical protein QOJ00_650 [Actinomycetota bacterium]|jgi:hypothetical protein
MLSSALFVAAGGYVHFREWFDTYRHLPSNLPGVAVVRVGFPLNAAASVVLVGALLFCALRRSKFSPWVVAAAIVFEVGSLLTLIATRVGNVFGWSEHIWTMGANQTRAVEIGALFALFGVIAVGALTRPLVLATVPAARR